LTQTQASEVLTTILSSRQTAARDHFLRLAVDYAHIRAEWALGSREDRAGRNVGRTAAHNAMIAACDALALAMDEAGEDGSWRPDVGSDRRDVGDFACQVHCLLGIAAR
jgi:hypothetical protein